MTDSGNISWRPLPVNWWLGLLSERSIGFSWAVLGKEARRIAHCVTIILSVALLGMALANPAAAFIQRAVEQLLQTNQCIRCDLRNADLRNRVLNKANLSGAYLVGARLDNSALVGADLSGAHMAGADLSAANLERADLTGADLTRAMLVGSRLRNAILSRARLSDAKLADADLTGARLKGTRLQGADLAQARGLTQEQLDQTCGNQVTTLPNGLRLSPCKENEFDRTNGEQGVGTPVIPMVADRKEEKQ